MEGVALDLGDLGLGPARALLDLILNRIYHVSNLQLIPPGLSLVVRLYLLQLFFWHLEVVLVQQRVVVENQPHTVKKSIVIVFGSELVDKDDHELL